MIPFEYQLWDADECATYFGQSKEYFLRTTRHAKDFPAPLEMSKQPRWRALAVAQWAIK